MDTQQLETFVSLVQQGSFRRVAMELGVTQPTVTIRIKLLEEEFGTPLLVRGGNKVTLTPAGQTIYESIERSLRVLKEGIDHCSGQKPPSAIRLSIAGTPNLSTYVLPKLLGSIYRAHPEWELNLLTANSWEVSGMVLDEVSHIGFLSGSFKREGVVTIPLFKDRFSLMAHPDHPLCRKDSLTLYDLTEETLLTYKLESNMSYMIKSLFRDIKQKTDLTMELYDAFTMRQMILKGVGIGFVPWSVGESDVKRGRLAILPLELGVPLSREINVIVLEKNIELPQVAAFLQLILEKYNPQGSEFFIGY